MNTVLAQLEKRLLGMSVSNLATWEATCIWTAAAGEELMCDRITQNPYALEKSDTPGWTSLMQVLL